MTHKTNGIVLRSIKYGETSIIASIYTALFGLQSYIVKGVRKASKNSAAKANYFQPAAILQLEVYNNELKNLQFIKTFEWQYLYNKIYTDVMRNAAATFVTELVLRSIKQPETNEELFFFIEETLFKIDIGSDALVANIPVYFSIQFAAALGFRLQGEYSNEYAVLDLQEGNFVSEIPAHATYSAGEEAKIISQLNVAAGFDFAENIKMNKNTRRHLLEIMQQYFMLHIQDFGEIKSLKILFEIFN